jgi:hypothetical protein
MSPRRPKARRHYRRRRRYRGPHPYARVGCFGPSVGCSGCLVVLLAVLAFAIAAAIAIM